RCTTTLFTQKEIYQNSRPRRRGINAGAVTIQLFRIVRDLFFPLYFPFQPSLSPVNLSLLFMEVQSSVKWEAENSGN
ncbi:hypothetical protein FRX31_033364, partial [Thalictrum thalictroides]